VENGCPAFLPRPNWCSAAEVGRIFPQKKSGRAAGNFSGKPPCPFSYLGLFAVVLYPAFSNAAGILFQHNGANDPATEGWTRNAYENGNNIIEGPVLESAQFGFDAWKIADTAATPPPFSTVATYDAALTPQQEAELETSDWTLSMRLRVATLPDGFLQGESSITVSLSFGLQAYYIRFAGTQDNDGMSILINNFSSGVLGTGYHKWDLIHNATTNLTRLVVDDVFTISNNVVPYVGANFVNHSLSWGSPSWYDTGQGNWNHISLTVPEPSTTALLALSALAITTTRRRRAPR
jgi:hypothetical protein